MTSNVSLPSINPALGGKRRIATGRSGLGTLKPLKSKRQRPINTGTYLYPSSSMPTLRPQQIPPRPLRLKAPKKEVRHSELRGQERKLDELTKGITKVFMNAMPMANFVEESKRILNDFGFNRDNSLAVVGLARDEVARPLLHALCKEWGDPYVTHSLGAQCNIGITGIKQCVSNAPEVQSNGGRKRLVIFTGPNIAVNQDSEVGFLYRERKSGVTNTNNELHEIMKSFKRGGLSVSSSASSLDLAGKVDMEDLEMSLLSAKLCKQIGSNSMGFLNDLNLTNMTKLAAQSAREDFENLIYNSLDLNKVDVAVVSCIQIHGQYHDNGEAEKILYDTEFVTMQKGFVVVRGGGERLCFRKCPNRMGMELCADGDDNENVVG